MSMHPSLKVGRKMIFPSNIKHPQTSGQAASWGRKRRRQKEKTEEIQKLAKETGKTVAEIQRERYLEAEGIRKESQNVPDKVFRRYHGNWGW